MARHRWLLLAAFVSTSITPGAMPGAAEAAVSRPNVVVIMIDDLTLRQYLAYMPKTRARLEPFGTTFANSFVSFSECCPSRATFLTGQYAHNRGVRSGNLPTGGYTKLDHRSTLPVWLQAAGYRTTHIGKYLNGYGYDAPPDVPPGWDDWFGLIDPTTQFAYGYKVDDNGTVVTYGTTAADQREDVLTNRAIQTIDAAAERGEPFFLSFNPPAPHIGYRDPAGYDAAQQAASAGFPSAELGYFPPPVTAGTLAGAPVAHSPAFNEADVSDKPAFRRTPLLSDSTVSAVDAQYRSSSELVLALDGSISRLIDRLQERGVLNNTLVLLTSDNGVYFGEHRITSGKLHPFEEGVRVPLVVRGPGFPAGSTEARPVANVDLAPTIVAASGAIAGRTMDGTALQWLLANPTRLAARPILLETGPLWGRRHYVGVRKRGYKYLEHSTGERELYNLTSDPYELRNRAGDPALATVQASLRKTLLSLRGCAGATCLSPPVPSGVAAPFADAGADSQVAPNQTVGLDGTLSYDPDGGALTYRWTQIGGTPTGILGATKASALGAAPSTFQTLRYRLTVTDRSGRSASDVTTVTIGYPYHAPIVRAGPDRTVPSGASVTLVASASSDTYPATALRYAWTQISGPRVANLAGDTSSTSFRAPTGPTTLRFRIIARDPTWRRATDLVTVTVDAPG